MLTFFYIGAFMCRAIAWHFYVKGQLTIKYAFYGVGISLFVNHLLPFKAGDAIRVAAAVKSGELDWEKSIHSVFVLRLIDLLFLGLVAGMGVLLFAVQFSFHVSYLFIIGIVIVGLWMLLRRFQYISQKMKLQIHLLREGLSGRTGLIVIGLTVLSWCLEGAVLYYIAEPLLTPYSAIWVNSMAVASGVFQITPGGIGTYESVMSAALVALGVELTNGYHLSLATHAYKFIFSYTLGIILWISFRNQLSFNDIVRKGGRSN
ncbi:hypothetical protein BFG57_03960 [Bacillus solimangrovi]|uniref:Phosphatidylglycerol lysyltransferase n=2 Tax=Bacillus solimangrovi TaxID=1305675 RepID=A0A1E5LCX6_9BACI|nr:hypothetical protein BFG57_03960 [Bacillus solimangrovi]